MKLLQLRERRPARETIPVIDDGAPLKRQRAEIEIGVEGPIPVIDDGAPLKRCRTVRSVRCGAATRRRSPSSMTGPR